MEEHNLLEEGQIIYVNEGAMVLDGKDIQYVLPQGIKDGNILVHEDGTPFTHYLLDSESVATVGDKDHIVIQHTEYSENKSSGSTSEEETQILQYNFQEQDVVAQVILNDEQCRMLQDFGRVIIQQGSKKYLLDGEGLKEIDHDFDLNHVNSIIADDENTSKAATNGLSNERDVGEESRSEKEVCEEDGEQLEYIVPTGTKEEAVFEFLHDKCDAILEDCSETNENMESGKNSEIIFTDNLTPSRNVQGSVSDTKNNTPKDGFSENESVEVNSGSSTNNVITSKLLDNSHWIRDIAESMVLAPKMKTTQSSSIQSLVTIRKVNFSNSRSKKDLISPIKCKSLSQIRNGKIVMMPEDARTPYVKELIKTHFANTKGVADVRNAPVPNIEPLPAPKQNKLSLKNLKNHKIYIGSTEDGKHIYGKIIDIIKPANGVITQSLPETNSAINEVSEHPVIETTNANFKNVKKKKRNLNIDIEDVRKNKKLKVYSAQEKVPSISSPNTTDLNKLISKKESSSSHISNSIVDLNLLPVNNGSSNSYTIETGSKANTSSTSDVETEIGKIIVPTTEELERLNTMLSRISKNVTKISKNISLNMSLSFTSRNILVVKETDSGVPEIFSGTLKTMLEDDNCWNFSYVPELWSDGRAWKDALKSENFLIFKLTHNDATDLKVMVVMGKVKRTGNIMEEAVNSTNSTFVKKIMFCPFCTKVFYRMSPLSRHLAIHTTLPDTYNCPCCSSVFCFQSTLTRHLREEHIFTDEINSLKVVL